MILEGAASATAKASAPAAHTDGCLGQTRPQTLVPYATRKPSRSVWLCRALCPGLSFLSNDFDNIDGRVTLAVMDQNAIAFCERLTE